MDQIKILLVEDSDDDLYLALRACLKSGVPYELLRLHDGEEALAFVFRTGRFANRPPVLPKLVILDVKMPKLDGIEVLRQLKGSEVTREIHVAMLTASSDAKDRVECSRLGADFYLTKPLTPEVFVGILERLDIQTEASP